MRSRHGRPPAKANDLENGEKKPRAEIPKAVVRERKVGKGEKAPLEEGLIRIGLPCSWKGATSAHMELRGGGHRNSIIFGRECLQVNGNLVRVLGSGERKDECGNKSAIVTILNKEANHIEQEVEILPCEEALMVIGGAKCAVVLSGPAREADPNADTNPRFEIPSGLSREEEGMVVRELLQRGESVGMLKSHTIRFIGGGPKNRFLEIIRLADGKCEAEFCAEDGDKFEIRVSGIKGVLVLRLMKGMCAQDSAEVFIYPKEWEK